MQYLILNPLAKVEKKLHLFFSKNPFHQTIDILSRTTITWSSRRDAPLSIYPEKFQINLFRKPAIKIQFCGKIYSLKKCPNRSARFLPPSPINPVEILEKLASISAESCSVYEYIRFLFAIFILSTFGHGQKPPLDWGIFVSKISFPFGGSAPLSYRGYWFAWPR